MLEMVTCWVVIHDIWHILKHTYTHMPDILRDADEEKDAFDAEIEVIRNRREEGKSSPHILHLEDGTLLKGLRKGY